ncbi:hypothetical protein AgCh_000999 [Apium graveolens]
MDELNSKFSIQGALSSSQQSELCNGSAPNSYLIPGLGNSSRNGSALLSSASSSQLGKQSAFMEEGIKKAYKRKLRMHKKGKGRMTVESRRK